jgi:hypothetical protein
MNLAKNYHTVLVILEKKGGTEELFAVFARFKFEIHRRRLSRNHVGKLRLADPTRANRGDGGVPRTRLARSLRARRAFNLAYHPRRRQ